MKNKAPKYFEILNDDRIKCLLCSHFCILKTGSTGICGVNINSENELSSLVYGKPVAISIDPVEKKPLDHFLKGSKTFSIGSFGCNFKCIWCQNHNLSQVSSSRKLPEIEIIPPQNIVSQALKNNCLSISYTYNEPTVFYPYARDIGILAKEKYLKNIFVSNGYQSEIIIEDMITWVDAVNIDLKGFDNAKYREFTGGNLDIVLRNLKKIANSEVHLEISTLIIPQYNDSEDEISEIAEFIAGELGKDVPWHVSAFHPGYKMKDRNRTSAETIYKAVDIGISKGLKFVYPGNI